MVPHGAVEQEIAKHFDLDQAEGPVVVIVGIPDPVKGEALVLLTTVDLGAEAVRNGLAAAGLPNLWIPRIVGRVAVIPLLGTGKTDLIGCRDLAAMAADRNRENR
jgi:acyl-[acyl-carrier-protein]-phospholipid O-acyltransferase/long-chain-fatty-acid--[acyl-carrier-protein] ligase